jgi:hypothetical protein
LAGSGRQGISKNAQDKYLCFKGNETRNGRGAKYLQLVGRMSGGDTGRVWGMGAFLFAWQILLGAFRALLISGGAYWRVALAPIFIPALKNYEWAVAVLTALGMEQIPNWYFYIFALSGAVLILSFRLALLEIARVKIIGLKAEKLNDRTYLYIVLKNISSKAVTDIKASITSSEPSLSFTKNPKLLPIVLTTQQRLSRQREEIEPVPQRRFSLGGQDVKKIEVFSAVSALEGEIEHESGKCKIRLFPKYLLTITLNGTNSNLECKIYIISSDENGKEKWRAFLIRDAADEYVFHELGLTRWW